MFIFENLEAYKKAMNFAKNIYGLRNQIKDRTIKDQLLRATLSIPLNIAEGQGRIHKKEKRQFYQTARASLFECLPIIQVCLEIKIIDQHQYENLYLLMDEVGRMISGLINSLD